MIRRRSPLRVVLRNENPSGRRRRPDRNSANHRSVSWRREVGCVRERGFPYVLLCPGAHLCLASYRSRDQLVSRPQDLPTTDLALEPARSRLQRLRDWTQNSPSSQLVWSVVGLLGGAAAIAGAATKQLDLVAFVVVAGFVVFSAAIVLAAARQVKALRQEVRELNRSLEWRGVPEQRRRQERLVVEDMVGQASLILSGERQRGIDRPKASAYSGWDPHVLGDLYTAVSGVQFDARAAANPPAPVPKRAATRGSYATRPEVNAPRIAARMKARRAEIESLEAEVQAIAAERREPFASAAAEKRAVFERLSKERREDTPAGRARKKAQAAREATRLADEEAFARLTAGRRPTAPPQPPVPNLTIPLDGGPTTRSQQPARPTPEQIANDYPGSVEPPPEVGAE